MENSGSEFGFSKAATFRANISPHRIVLAFSCNSLSLHQTIDKVVLFNTQTLHVA
jgi:hypothetical protein